MAVPAEERKPLQFSSDKLELKYQGESSQFVKKVFENRVNLQYKNSNHTDERTMINNMEKSATYHQNGTLLLKSANAMQRKTSTAVNMRPFKQSNQVFIAKTHNYPAKRYFAIAEDQLIGEFILFAKSIAPFKIATRPSFVAYYD